MEPQLFIDINELFTILYVRVDRPGGLVSCNF